MAKVWGQKYPNGSKYWRLRYRIAGKAKLISLGVYPEVSLKEAREKALELKKLIKSGIDPSQKRKKDKLELKENIENTFENIAREWFKSREHALSKRHSFYIFRRLETNIFPFIGSCPIKKIARNDILDTIKKQNKEELLRLRAEH